MKRLHSSFLFIIFVMCILACATNGALGQDVAPNDPPPSAAESNPSNTDNDDSSQAPMEGEPADPEEVVVDDTAPDTSSDPAPVSEGDSSPAPTGTPSNTPSSSASDGLSGGAIAAIIGGSVAVLSIGAAVVTAISNSDNVEVLREMRSKPLSMKERRDMLLSKN